MSNVNFTIRISSQNGEPSTHKVVCDIHNTIGELRRLIQTTHPSCPDPLDQKLIFMGQLWKNNEEILKNNLKMVSILIIRYEDIEEKYTRARVSGGIYRTRGFTRLALLAT